MIHLGDLSRRLAVVILREPIEDPRERALEYRRSLGEVQHGGEHALLEQLLTHVGVDAELEEELSDVVPRRVCGNEIVMRMSPRGRAAIGASTTRTSRVPRIHYNKVIA